MKPSRVLPIKGGQNFRDLGGYQTLDGHHVKWGRLYRSGRLGRLTNDDLAELHQRHVVADIDFRTTVEQQNLPDKVPTGATYYGNQIFKPRSNRSKIKSGASEEEAAEAIGPGQGAMFMKHNYQAMIENDYCQSSFRRFFNIIEADGEKGAVLFHCTAGKDRTGVGAYLLLRALGVDEKTATNDYLLTNPTIKPILDNRITHFRQSGATDDQITNFYDMASVKLAYIGTAKKTIKKLAGNTETYLRQYLNFTDEEFHQLRQLFLD